MAAIRTTDPGQSPTAEPLLAVRPCLDDLVTEDDTPVDNMFSEKQQRLLTEPLYSSWDPGRPFLATANVGLFYAVHQPPLVPDALLSLDVQVSGDWLAKEHRSYFVWEFGKAPEAVVEIVSNTEEGETTNKMHKYAKLASCTTRFSIRGWQCSQSHCGFLCCAIRAINRVRPSGCRSWAWG